MSDNQPRVHESFVSALEVQGPSDRAFGFTFAAIFLLVALVPLVHHKSPRAWAFILSALFIVVSLAFPRILHRFNVVWSKLGLLLAKVTNPIFAGLMFYLLFTPIAYFRRLGGKDPLRLKLDRAADTYWIPRVPPGPSPESMRNLF